MTRAVNVDALKPWSIVEMRYFSTAGRVLGLRVPRRASCRGSSRRTEVGVRRDRLEALAQPLERGRSASGTTAHVDIALSRSVACVDVERRPEAERRAEQRDRGAQRVERDERLARARDRGQHRRRPRAGSRAAARISAANASRSASVSGSRPSNSRYQTSSSGRLTPRGRPRCTGGSGRSPRGRGRRRRSSRRRRRLRGPAGPRGPAPRRAGSSRCA